jgi:hypothetical protein
LWSANKRIAGQRSGLDGRSGAMMKAIVIREPYISLVLDGKKTWEMRSRRANYRGRVALIKKAHRGILWVNSRADMEETPDNKGFFEV